MRIYILQKIQRSEFYDSGMVLLALSKGSELPKKFVKPPKRNVILREIPVFMFYFISRHDFCL